jgi:competence protein ComGC
MNTHAVCKRGFTRIETLLVAAMVILAILLGLPGLVRQREAARLAECAGKLKQIGVALHLYHDTHRSFPAGMISGWDAGAQVHRGNGFSWGAGLLPHMGYTELSNKLDFRMGVSVGTNREAIEALGGIPEVLCPADVGRPKVKNMWDFQKAPTTSYFGSVGAFDSWCQSDLQSGCGGFFVTDPGRPATMASLTDGLSNTIAVGEGSHRVDKECGVWLGLQRPSPTAEDTKADGINQYLHMGIFPITNERLPTIAQYGLRFGSQHERGMNCLMGDGAVRFVSVDIDHIVSLIPAPGWDPDVGCWLTGGPYGCASGVPPRGGVFQNKRLLANVMGIWQRLHHGSDGLGDEDE